MTAEGDGQAFDAFDVNHSLGVGEWRDSNEFIAIHSQDPGAAMDDRFDMHLVTENFFDEYGLELVQGSFRVFGNNGTHTLDTPITTGTGAVEDVLMALAGFGDHLPVVSDFVIGDLLIGDINGDRSVDFDDFVILSNNFGFEGAMAIEGDIDGNRIVDFDDFALLSNNFGATAVASIPEPSGLARLGVILFVGFRRAVRR